MKRRLSLITVLIFAMSIIFTACGNSDAGDSGDAEDSNNASGNNKEKVELEMYSWRTEDRSAYEKIIDKFEEENPGITINFQPFKATEYNTILSNALISGSGPDIVQLRPYDGMKSIADDDYLTPLDDLNGLENIDELYLQAAQGSDGKVYGVPLALNAIVIWYNKSIFEEYNLDIPETWEELIEVSETLKDNGIIPIAQGGRDAPYLKKPHDVVISTVPDWDSFLDELIEGDTDLTDPRFVESVKKMKELQKYFPDDFIALNDDDAQTLFYTGEAAMYIIGDYKLPDLEKNAPDLPLGVITGLSAEKEEDTPVATYVDGSYGVVKTSKHQEEAKKFMEFMTSEQFGQMLSDELLRLSAVPGIKSDHPITQQIIEDIEKNSTPALISVYYRGGEPATEEVFVNALQGMYLGELTVEEVAKETQDNVDRNNKE